MTTPTCRRVAHALHLLVVLAVAASLLALAPPPDLAAAADTTLPTFPTLDVRITDSGVEPATASVRSGQSVRFRNEASGPVTLVADDGTFDSGEVPPGGAFVVALDGTDRVPFAVAGAVTARGLLVLALDRLPGADSANARAAIPRLTPPPMPAGDLSRHPDYGLPTSRTRILVLPTATATVGQVNAAVASVGGLVTAGFDVLDTLVVSIPDTGDHTALLAALGTLRAAAGIRAAAPVWQGGVERTTEPTDLVTDPAKAGPITWNLHDVRALEAWNVLDTARTYTGTRPEVLVIDAGFDPGHPDLAYASLVPDPATWNPAAGAYPVDDHGTHVAGTIGARFANPSTASGRTLGVNGIDPLARVHGMRFRSQPVVAVSDPSYTSLPNTIEDFSAAFNVALTSGQYPSLRAINASFGAVVFSPTYARDFLAATAGGCGPDLRGDGEPANCTPETHEKFQQDLEAVAATYAAQVLTVAAQRNIVIVRAAGNDNSVFCLEKTIIATPERKYCRDLPAGDRTPLPLPAIATNEFSVARRQMGGTAPLLVVGAHGQDGNPADFSQAGGDVSAPGKQIVSTVPAGSGAPGTGQYQAADGSWYAAYDGTSMAAPHVTGAISLLHQVAYNLSWATVVDLVKLTARSASSGPPQLDVFALVAARVGATPLVDVNDASLDGSERFVLDDRNRPYQSAGVPSSDALGQRWAAPDGTVDLRDFRRFRDAWLQMCSQRDPSDVCTTGLDVALDGYPDSPAKDANFDGCVTDPAAADPCLRGEAEWSRFDYNGNGLLDADAATVPIDPESGYGKPTNPPLLSDLDVLRTAIRTGPPIEGWSRDQLKSTSLLDQLLFSGDLHVRLDPAFPTAAAAQVWVDYGTATLTHTIQRSSGQGLRSVLTVPVDPGGSPVRVWAKATVAGQAVTTNAVQVDLLRPGQDVAVAPCPVRLTAEAGRTTLVPSATTRLIAELDGCPQLPAGQSDGGEVVFSVASADPGAPTTLVDAVPIEADGLARNDLIAGDAAGTYEVRSAYRLPDGSEVAGPDLTVAVVPEIRVDYVWRSTLQDYAETGSTRWPSAPPGMPDCAGTGQVCVDTYEAGPAPGALAWSTERRGTLRLTPDGVQVTEEIVGGAGATEVTYEWTKTDGTTGTATNRYTFDVLPGERNRYVDEPMAGMDLTLDGDDVRLDGLEQLTLLGYRSRLAADLQPYSAPDPGVLTVPPDLFLKPDEDGSNPAWPVPPTFEVCIGAIEFDGVTVPVEPCPRPARQLCIGAIELDGVTAEAPPCRPPSGPLYFEPAPSGGFEPHQSCSVKRRSLDAGPGYRVAEPDEWVAGASALDRDPVYDPGDVPLPETTGSISFQSGLAATVSTDGSAPAAPVLPDCAEPSPPTAAFEVLLPPDGKLEEGDTLRLADRSTDAHDDIVTWAWTFGDGRTSTVSDPVVSGYENNGSYTITLTVTDADGATATATETVTVVNAPPTIEAVPQVVVVPAGGIVRLTAAVDDQGAIDARQLTFRTGSVGYGIPSPQQTVRRGVHTLTIGGTVPAGEHRIPVIVTDPDGATASADVTVVVLAAQAPLPPPPPPPLFPVAATCNGQVHLSSWEADLLDRVKEARTASNAGTPAVSRALTVTAVDVARARLAGAPVDLQARAAANGYAGAQGQLAAVTLDGQIDPVAALAQATGVPLAVLLGPGWQMLGVARVSDGTRAEAVVVFGDVVDCDDPPVAAGAPPTVALTAPTTAAEGTNVTLAVTPADPDGDVAEVLVYWGDGTIGGTTHRFPDEGTFTVTVTVADEQGATASQSTTVAVTNAPPELELVVQEPAVVGRWTGITAIVADLGERDRPLQLQLSSTLPSIGSVAESVSGPALFGFEPTTAGQFTVTADVTDPDGAQTTAQLTFDVLPAAPPPAAPPANVTVTAPACSTGVPVRAQAADYLTASNGYRAAQGLAPLVADPALTAAAERHLADMTAGQFMAHNGRDGSDPFVRARDAGYTGSIGENLVKAAVTPRDALAAWRMSPPHHANLLDPTWQATGVAVGNSPIGVLWVQVFGDEVTCPTAPPGAPAPEVLANPRDVLRGVLAYPAPAHLVAPEATVTPTLRSATVPEAPVSRQAAPLPTGTAAAYTVSDVEPLTGEQVTVLNVSRWRGQPAGASVTMPGGGTRTLAAGDSLTTRFVSPGPAEISLRLVSVSAAVSARSTLAVSGETIVPTIVLSAPGEAAQGERLGARVTVTDVNGEALSGRTVRVFLVAVPAVSATGVTAADGTATVPLPMDTPTGGSWQVRAAVLDDTGTVTAQSNVVDVTVTTNLPAVADAGGPYLVNLGDSVTLDASRSYDPGVGGAVTGAAWDLDSDGQFGDAAGSVVEVPWPLLERVLCRSACATDRDYPVAVQVVDEAGATSQAATTLRFQREYGLFVTPESHTIAPGGSNQFTVSAVTTSGFDEEIDLTAPGLPTGVTASFSPTRVRPGQQATMTVNLASTLQGVTSIDLTVRGVSRATGVVREASPTVSVVFGLVPVCTATLRGSVLDAETGLPIADARVSVGSKVVTTGAGGRWEATDVALGSDNRPLQYSIPAVKDGYWYASVTRSAVCGVVGEADISLVPVKSVPVRLYVREGQPDPRRPNWQLITDGIPPGSAVRPAGPNSTEVPLAAGGYADVDVTLAYNNADRLASNAYADAPGYWGSYVQDPPTLTAAQVGGPRVEAYLPLLRKCSVHLVGGVVRDPNGAPAAGATVTTGSLRTVTDAAGRFRFDTDVPMQNRNSPVYVYVHAAPPAGMAVQANYTYVYGDVCGEQLTADIWLVKPTTPPPPPVRLPTTVSGTVRDAVTGAPVAGASVWAAGRSATTAEDGTYRVTFDENEGATITVSTYAWRSGYWARSSPYQTVRAGVEAIIDLVLTPIRTGAAEVVVRDLATGLPIEGATVWIEGPAQTTGPDGRLRFDPVSLNSENAPRVVSATASAPGYWTRSVQLEARAGETAFVDLGLLRECQPADVRGLVLDAVTGLPLAGAQVSGSAGSTTTGPDGTFLLTGIRMRLQNTPWQFSLTASKTGYLSQTKSVLVFCGARIAVDYGPQPIDPGVVEGRVTRADTGAPVAGAVVGTDFGGSATTAADGTYRITGAPTELDGTPKAWGVTAQAPFEQFLHPASTTVTIEPGATTRADLVLDPMAPPNRFPLAAVVSPATGPEGSPIPLDAGASTDPDGDALTFAWDLDGDGAYDDADGPTPMLTLPLAGTRTVQVKVTDDKLLTDTAPVTVVATNVVPVVDAGSDVTVPTGTTVTRTVTFTDPGADTWTVERGWSDEPATTSDVSARSIELSRTFATPGTFTFTATVRDTRGGEGTASFTVSVEGGPPNRPPVATIVGTAVVDEGAVATFDAGSSADPDGDPLAFAWDLDGDGEYDDARGPTADLPAGPPGTRPVAVQATDPAGASATAVVTITVRNLPPTLDATIPSEAVPASEVSVPLSATDAGPGPLVGTIDWGDGSGPVPVELTPTGAPEGVAARVFATASGTAVQGTPTHTYTIAGVFAVVVTVCDPQEACATQTGEITVSEQPPDNRAPRAVLDGPAAVDEGGAIVLSAARSDDPDGDPLVYAWTIDGVPAGTADSVEVRGLRPGPLAVAVTVADGRGGRASASTTVTVANLPPTVTLDGPADEVPLATPVTMAVLATDPGDQALTAALDGGTGATPLELVPVTVTSGVAFSAAPVVSFAEPGDHPVTVTVCDPSGACAAARRTVRVAAPPPPPPSPPNEAPQAVIDSPTTVDEGAPVTVSGERSADPDGDALTYRWRVSGAESGNGPALVLPGRGHGVVEVELIVDDGRGGTTAARAAVTVRNLPPSVRATGEPTVLVGQAWALAVDAADPWSSRLTTRVEWGDGSVTDLSSAVASGHTYQHPGTYVVTVTVCDDADACTQTSTLVSATAPVPAAPPVLGELPATGTSPRPLVQLAVLLVLLGAVACGLTGRSQPSGGRAPTRRRHV